MLLKLQTLYIKMKDEKLETETREFNNRDYNNQRAILGFIVDRSREGNCRICEEVYHRKFCILCKEIITYHNALEIYDEINQRGLGSFKLEI